MGTVSQTETCSYHTMNRCSIEIGLNTFGLTTVYNCYQYANDTDLVSLMYVIQRKTTTSPPTTTLMILDMVNIVIHPLFIVTEMYMYLLALTQKKGYTFNDADVWIVGANATKDFNKTLAIQTSMYSVLETDLFDFKDSSSSYSINNNWRMHHHTSLLLIGGVVYFFLF